MSVPSFGFPEKISIHKKKIPPDADAFENSASIIQFLHEILSKKWELVK
jgi:hypothetical protein